MVIQGSEQKRGSRGAQIAARRDGRGFWRHSLVMAAILAGLAQAHDASAQCAEQRSLAGSRTARSVLPSECGAVISNGTVELGINCEGDLNVPVDDDPIGIYAVGLRYVPTGNPSTEPGCLCEGWGAADSVSGTSGWADKAAGNSNITVLSFTSTADSAVSTVQVGSTYRVTHSYQPTSNANIYEVRVAITNISSSSTSLLYRRVMDWDIYPTPFAEYVTINNGTAANLFRTDTNGFNSPDPFEFSSYEPGPVTDSGPADHGALFDFDFGTLAPGETKEFRTFYGAAGSEVDALAALTAVGAEAFSLGEPSSEGGKDLGIPNTFMFAFAGVGGTPVFCGNNVLDPGEQCEDGNTIDGDGCDSNCRPTGCGNGIVTAGEQCDDGNTADGDCCSSTCQFAPSTTECRAATGPCDTAEFCTGSSGSCPIDSVANDGTSCADSLFCNGAEVCSGGACVAGPLPCGEAGGECAGECNEELHICASPALTPCSDDGNPCTDDVCDGLGHCGVPNTAPCDDGLYCDGSETCVEGTCTSSGSPCAGGECSTCDESTDSCGFLTAGTACTADTDECTDDVCDGSGGCIHPAIPLAPVCNWTIVDGKVRTRLNADVDGSICSERGEIGEASSLTGGGSWALTGDNGTALRVRPSAALDDGSVVTAGGCISGLHGADILGTGSAGPICCANGDVVLPGGNPANVINACGTNPLIAKCTLARSEVGDDVTLLDGLTSTQSLGTISIGPGATVTIPVVTGLNVVDVDKIKINRGGILQIDAQGNPDAVVVVRMANGINTKVHSQVNLVGGALARNVVLYAANGNCNIGWGSVGAGTLYCPAGKVRLKVDTEWTGGIVGGGSVDVGWGAVVSHIPFLGLAE